MKNKTIIMLTVATIAMLTSCVGAEIVQRDETENEQNIVNFSAEQSLYGEATRLSGTSWTAGDLIGITMLSTDQTALYTNYKYSAATAGSSVNFAQQSGNMYFPSGNTNVTVAAYYPYSASLTDGKIYVAAVSGSEELLYAKTTANGSLSKNVQLDFKHQLAKVVLKFVAGTGSPTVGFIGGFMPQLIYNGYFNITTGVLTGDTSFLDVTDLNATSNINECYALVFPQTIAASSYITIQLTSGLVSMDFSNTVIEAGKQYTYTLTINKGTAAISNITITDRTTTSSSQSLEL